MHVDLDLEKKIKACKDSKELAKFGLEQPGGERALATHEKADSVLLRKLATHGDKYVRMAVAQHTNTDEQTLKILARDREVVIREAARLNLILKR